MATYKIRYFVEKPGQGNTLRYFWQPSKALRNLGWRPKRLAADRMAAINEAEVINQLLEGWRAGDPLPGMSAPNLSAPRALITIADLIDKYRASALFLAKMPITRRNYILWLNVIKKWSGDTPVPMLTREACLNLYEELMAASHSKANAVMRVLRLLLAFAKDAKMITENPAAKPRMVAVPPRDQVWPDHAIDAFVNLADAMGRPSIGTACMIAADTGQRQGDILKLTRAKFIGGRFRLRQGKTKVWVDVRPTVELAERLQTLDKNQLYFVTSEVTNAPYETNDFNHNFVKIRKRLIEEFPEYAELRYQDLRRTAVVHLGEADCDEHEIAAITGHKIEHSRQILETYLPRTTPMADNAIAKMDAHRASKREAQNAAEKTINGEAK